MRPEPACTTDRITAWLRYTPEVKQPGLPSPPRLGTQIISHALHSTNSGTTVSAAGSEFSRFSGWTSSSDSSTYSSWRSVTAAPQIPSSLISLEMRRAGAISSDECKETHHNLYILRSGIVAAHRYAGTALANFAQYRRPDTGASATASAAGAAEQIHAMTKMQINQARTKLNEILVRLSSAHRIVRIASANPNASTGRPSPGRPQSATDFVYNATPEILRSLAEQLGEIEIDAELAAIQLNLARTIFARKGATPDPAPATSGTNPDVGIARHLHSSELHLKLLRAPLTRLRAIASSLEP